MQKKILIIVLTVLFITAGYFSYSYVKKVSMKNTQPAAHTPTEVRTVTTATTSKVVVAEKPSEKVVVAQKTSEKVVVPLSQRLLGTWKSEDKESSSESYSLENGKYVYRSYDGANLVSQGSWAVQDDGMLSIINSQGGYSLRVEIDTSNQKLTYFDEDTVSVWIRVNK